MADRSAIEWTGATWNPTTGCDRTSPGCDHCYALTLGMPRLFDMVDPPVAPDRYLHAPPWRPPARLPEAVELDDEPEEPETT